MTHDTHARADWPGPGRVGANGEVPPTPNPRRWLALTVVLAAGFMDLLDVTIVNVAVPSILRDLRAAYTQIEWIVAGYVLGFAAVLITGGRLGDIFGRKRLFLVGVGGFTIASALCGLAQNPAMLIGARFLQGAMAGLMVPQILAIIHVTFPAEERGKAFGLWGGILGSASVAGLIIGGLLVQWNLFGLEWRPIFLVNVPVGLAAMVAAWLVVPESRSPSAPRLDLVGMALAVTGVLLLVYPLAEGRSLGWPLWTFLLMAGAVVVLALFIAYERWRTRTVGSPLVVLSLFRARSFASGMVVWLIFWVAFGGFFLVWTLYLQVGLGWTPLRAGLTAVSFAVGAAAGAGVSVQMLTPRFGRRVLLVGALLSAVGFGGYIWVGSHYGPAIHSWQMVVPLVVVGVGFGLVVAPMIDAILTEVPVRDAGSASGLVSTNQQVGMALGVALVGVLFFALLADDSGRGVDAVTPGLRRQLTAVGIPAPAHDGIVAGFRACVQDRSAATDPTEVPASCQAGSAQPGSPPPDQVQELLTRAGVQANAHNFSRTFGVTLWYAVGILLVVFLGLFALPRRVQARDLDAELSALEEQPVGQP
jgi:EmrB/QacA subfamily drug resistance transporter